MLLNLLCVQGRIKLEARGEQQYKTMKAGVRVIYQQELNFAFTPGQRASSVSAYDSSKCPCAVSGWLGDPAKGGNVCMAL